MTKDSNMASNRPGATAPMEERDRIETRSQLETCSHAVGQGVGLAAASLSEQIELPCTQCSNVYWRKNHDR